MNKSRDGNIYIKDSCYDGITRSMLSRPCESVIYDVKYGISELVCRLSISCITRILYCSRSWGVNCLMYLGLSLWYMPDVESSPGDIMIIMCDHLYMVDLYIMKGLKSWYKVQYLYGIVWKTGFPLYLNLNRTCLNLLWYSRPINQLSITVRLSRVSRSNNDMFAGLSLFSGQFSRSVVSVRWPKKKWCNSGLYSISSGCF